LLGRLGGLGRPPAHRGEIALVGSNDVADDRLKGAPAASRAGRQRLATGGFHRLVERAPTRAEDLLVALKVGRDTRTMAVNRECYTWSAEVGRRGAGEALNNNQLGEILRNGEAQAGTRKDRGILGAVGEQCGQRVGFIRPLAAPARPIERGGKGALRSAFQVDTDARCHGWCSLGVLWSRRFAPIAPKATQSLVAAALYLPIC
jgi:hypothetical protein